jgi:hypothetical protein
MKPEIRVYAVSSRPLILGNGIEIAESVPEPGRVHGDTAQTELLLGYFMG